MLSTPISHYILKKTAAVNEEELYLTLQTIFGMLLMTNFPDIQTEV